ncbi:hypothetical protein MKW92_038308, partial [Papaver armeniacum]
EVLALKNKLATLQGSLTRALKERDSSSRPVSSSSQLLAEVSQERDELRRANEELEHSYSALDRKYSKENQRRVNVECQLAVNWVCEKHGLSREVYPQVPVSDDEEEDLSAASLGGDVEKEGEILSQQVSDVADVSIQVGSTPEVANSSQDVVSS